MKETILVAVYGTLRRGFHNYNACLKDDDVEYMGEYQTEPIYNMYSVGGFFPALTKDGYTSVTMEVFEVDKNTLERLDLLEGYDAEYDRDNHYNREPIITPYGNAFTYFYNQDTKSLRLILSGDWKEYINNKKLILTN